MVRLKLEGRDEFARFFEKSGLYYPNRNQKMSWEHYPVLAFIGGADPEDIEVRILTSPYDVERLPDSTRLLQQWPGQWRSDFFKFTVADARPFLSLR